MIRTKSAYEFPSPNDGKRILVDRQWPVGVTEEGALLDLWWAELAPAPQLLEWFNSDPAKFPKFREKFRSELLRRRDVVAELVLESEVGTVTLVHADGRSPYSSADVVKELADEAL
jgi:uncharacterized protein YeaO (DUF488 family)